MRCLVLGSSSCLGGTSEHHRGEERTGRADHAGVQAVGKDAEQGAGVEIDSAQALAGGTELAAVVRALHHAGRASEAAVLVVHLHK